MIHQLCLICRKRCQNGSLHLAADRWPQYPLVEVHQSCLWKAMEEIVHQDPRSGDRFREAGEALGSDLFGGMFRRLQVIQGGGEV